MQGDVTVVVSVGLTVTFTLGRQERRPEGGWLHVSVGVYNVYRSNQFSR